ncbi:conserved oligomeric Golgi complex subunit 5 (COG5), partial [Paratrimastix pyriformis]
PLYSLSSRIVEDAFGAAQQALCGALTCLLQEPFDTATPSGPSVQRVTARYTDNFATLAEYTRRYVLYYYSKHADFGARCAELTGRVLRHFCTLACLVRPLGEGGKLHLADDIARVEYAMQPLSKPGLHPPAPPPPPPPPHRSLTSS